MDAATNRILDQTLLGEALLTAGTAVLISDDEGRYIAVNDAAMELLGYSREELRSINVRDVSATPESELSELLATLGRGSSVEGTARLRRKDGTIGSIRHFTFGSSVGGLPVLVSVVAPVEVS